jgi:hypothetical protein
MQKRMGAQNPVVRGTSALGKRALLGLPFVATLMIFLSMPALAGASFHLMKVREVYPAGDSSYVELQMFSAGEYLVAGHELVAYNANGSVASEFPLTGNVSIASPNNSTVLIADSGYASAFPGAPAPDETHSGLNLSANGGAVCWVDGSPPDCVSWGSFTGPFPAHAPPLVAGSPASPAGVTAGKALRRSIEPGCPTLLESADDTDSSLADFSEQTPNPRSNASSVIEHTCTPPTATIDSKPKSPINSTSASFTYHSTPAGAAFECKRDTGAFASCPTDGIEYMGLAEGGHTFQVRAKNAEGIGGATVHTWTVDTKSPTASIKSHPVNPSSGASAAFTYQSDETNSTFECSLSEGAAADSFASCPSAGKTYGSLPDGSYAFKVRAIDLAGNPQPGSAQFSWEVDNSLIDPTPPEAPAAEPPPLTTPPPSPPATGPATPNTLITGKPTRRTRDRTPTFRFRATEAGAAFQCKLDGAPFKPCRSPLTTKTLRPGPHLLKVRAALAGNLDSSPASFPFTVLEPK